MLLKNLIYHGKYVFFTLQPVAIGFESQVFMVEIETNRHVTSPTRRSIFGKYCVVLLLAAAILFTAVYYSNV